MGNAVVDAIMRTTSDPHVRAAMLMGSSLESNWNPNAVGDHGTSFGPFQIHITVHPVSASQAKDPDFAAKYMLPAYVAGVNKVAPSLWQSDPAKAAATAAYYAERPAKMYSGYAAKWANVQAALSGNSIAGPTTGGSATPPGSAPVDSSGILGPLNSTIDSAVTDFRKGVVTMANMGLFFAATLTGGILMMFAVILLFRETSVGAAATGGASKLIGAGAVMKGLATAKKGGA